MGRLLKRVPLDFNWPLDKVWGGYLNPYWNQRAKCDACDGSGYGPEAKRFNDEWYGKVDFDPVAYGARQIQVSDPEVQEFARRNVERSPDYYLGGWSKKVWDDPGIRDLAIRREAKRLHELWANQWCHHLIQADVDALWESGRLGPNRGWKECPTADELNRAYLFGFGHDAINQCVCIEARCKREGVERLCTKCGGDGDLWPSPEIKKAYDDWKPEEPPKGDGYQLWENTTEGSPQSPVFATLQELCQYAAVHCTTFGSFKVTAEEWRQMLDDGFVHHKDKNGNIFI